MGEASIMRLEYKRGKRNPLLRFIYKIFPNLVQLKRIKSDLTAYDTLCLGIPVIAGRPSSSISKYISMCKNLNNKNIICCYVYGFEANAKRCARNTLKILRKKTNANIIEMFVPWNYAHKENELDSIIVKALSKLSSVSKNHL